MQRTNSAAPTPPNTKELNILVGNARAEYQSAKITPLKAAANAYLVWFHSASEHAEPQAKLWFNQKVETRNNEVKSHNATIDLLKRRVEQTKKATINEQLDGDEKAQVEKNLNNTVADWAALRMREIDARTNASEFTRVVKFVFGFQYAKDAQHISRYSKSLEYVDKHRSELSVESIVEVMTNAGGFDACIEAARGTGSQIGISPGSQIDTLDRFKKGLSNSQPLSQIPYQAKYAHDDYVLLVAHKDANQVSVLGEVKLTQEGADAYLLCADIEILGDRDPLTEFVAKVFSVGSVIREGKDSDKTLDDTVAGPKLKERRAFSICKTGTRESYVVVSLINGDASTVMHAHPAEGIDIGSILAGEHLVLPRELAVALESRVSTPSNRVMIEFWQDRNVHGGLVWNSGLTGGDRTTPLQSYPWVDMADQSAYPIDVSGFEPQFQVILKRSSVEEMLNGQMLDWGASSSSLAPEKRKLLPKPVQLFCDGETLKLSHEDCVVYEVSVGAAAGVKVQLKLRSRDWYDLLKKLVEQETEQFTFAGTADGMVSVGWSDNFGNYTVYMPSVQKSGSLETRCLRYMKPIR